MTSHLSPESDFGDSNLMNYVVRMVIPMRREFSRALDVAHFMHDFAYAREILEQAKASRDTRLREYALFVEGKMFGPRNAASGAGGLAYRTTEASPLESGPPAAQTVPAPATASTPGLTEAELRERMLRKYRSGLR